MYPNLDVFMMMFRNNNIHDNDSSSSENADEVPNINLVNQNQPQQAGRGATALLPTPRLVTNVNDNRQEHTEMAPRLKNKIVCQIFSNVMIFLETSKIETAKYQFWLSERSEIGGREVELSFDESDSLIFKSVSEL